jgi:phosphopantetheinyl transferase (holo-ACP synthase)
MGLKNLFFKRRDELLRCKGSSFEHYAARLLQKAFLKAWAGMGYGLQWNEIEIVNETNGKPLYVSQA